MGNIGIILGDASGGLVDANLDCHEAIELAPKALPATGTVFGRASKARSHYLYRVAGQAPTIKFSDPITGSSLLELRGDGGLQTVFPPSVHPCGELIEWAEEGEPATVDPAALVKAAKRLAAFCLLRRYLPTVRDYKALLTALERCDPRLARRLCDWLEMEHPSGGVDFGPRSRSSATVDPFNFGPMPAWLLPASTGLTTTLERALSAGDGTEYTPDNVARLQSALSTIPAVEREVWLHVGMALHSTGWPNAFEMWCSWSLGCPEKFNEAEQQKAWASFDRRRDGRAITIATVYRLARENGWSDKPPNAATPAETQPKNGQTESAAQGTGPDSGMTGLKPPEVMCFPHIGRGSGRYRFGWPRRLDTAWFRSRRRARSAASPVPLLYPPH
jgi:hypothetical protein